MWKQITGGMAAIAMVAGCATADVSLPAEVSATEAHALMAERGVVLIDVRRASEWAESGVAEGAYRATLQDPDFVDQVAAILREDTTTEVAFICRSGGRSAAARDQIIAAGYTNATSVAGGTLMDGGWAESGLPLVPVE